MSDETLVEESLGSLSIDEAASRAIDEVVESTPDEDKVIEASSDRAEESAAESASPQTEEEFREWDKLPPQAKKAYETERKRAEESKKSYENYRSLMDKKSADWKKQEESYKGHQTKAQQFDQLDHLYRTNPAAKQAIDDALGIGKKVDPTLAADPLYQYMTDYQKQMESKLNPLLEFYQNETKTRQERQLSDQVNAIEKSAVQEFKTFFGKEPNQAELAKIYETMSERQVYDGPAAVKAAFMEEIVSARIQAKLAEQSAKKTKSGKTTSINPSKAVSSGKVRSYKDAAELAWEELGIQF